MRSSKQDVTSKINESDKSLRFIHFVFIKFSRNLISFGSFLYAMDIPIFIHKKAE